ncbi:MAG: ankyrin repeat domain-containing protein [Chlamydiota bacterium]
MAAINNQSYPSLQELSCNQVIATLKNPESDINSITVLINKIKKIQKNKVWIHAKHPQITTSAWETLPRTTLTARQLKPFIQWYTTFLSSLGENHIIHELSLALCKAIEHDNYSFINAICLFFKNNDINYIKIQKMLPDLYLLNYIFLHQKQWTDANLEKAFRSLLELGYSIDEPNSLGQTPLHLACAYRRHALVLFLLKKGANPDKTDKNQNTIFHFAAGHSSYAKQIDIKYDIFRLFPNKAKINTFNKDGYTPLMIAAACSNVQSVNTLIEDGADIDIQNPKSLQTALHMACDYRSIDIAIALINKGASADLTDATGKTPLHYVCITEYNRYFEPLFLITRLIEQGADSKICTPEGDLPYDLLLENNEETLTHILISSLPFFNPYNAEPDIFVTYTKNLSLSQQYRRLEKANLQQITAYLNEEITFSHEVLSVWNAAKTQDFPLIKLEKIAKQLVPVIQLATLGIMKIEKTIKSHAEHNKLAALLNERVKTFREKLKELQIEIKMFQNKQITETQDSSPVPDEFICPITKQIMENPVKDKYGHHYDRDAIINWVRQTPISPKTGTHLAEYDFTPDEKLKQQIQEYQSKKRKRDNNDVDLQDNKYQKLENATI